MACGKRPLGGHWGLKLNSLRFPQFTCSWYFFNPEVAREPKVFALAGTGPKRRGLKRPTTRWQVTNQTTSILGKVTLCYQNFVLGMSGLLSKTNTI